MKNNNLCNLCGQKLSIYKRWNSKLAICWRCDVCTETKINKKNDKYDEDFWAERDQQEFDDNVSNYFESQIPSQQ